MKKPIALILCGFLGLSCTSKTQKETDSKPMNKTEEVGSFHSERIRDTVFENVIEIKEDDVAKNGTAYRFKVPIPKTGETPVLFVSARVPLATLSSIYPEVPNVIVIAPNWNYYDEVAQERTPQEVLIEPRTSTVVYEFNREQGKLRKDSIIIMDHLPEMRFKQ